MQSEHLCGMVYETYLPVLRKRISLENTQLVLFFLERRTVGIRSYRDENPRNMKVLIINKNDIYWGFIGEVIRGKKGDDELLVYFNDVGEALLYHDSEIRYLDEMT